ncbi:hypothetical protein QEV70_00775 [Trueperella pyogenes]|uniref:hypothetical protein n=1 Tax=Trueperella pyogenes TaxID=1661 RepID=UPI003243EF21
MFLKTALHYGGEQLTGHVVVPARAARFGVWGQWVSPWFAKRWRPSAQADRGSIRREPQTPHMPATTWFSPPVPGLASRSPRGCRLCRQ